MPGQLSAWPRPKAILLFDKLSAVAPTNRSKRTPKPSASKHCGQVVLLGRYHNFTGQAVFMFCPDCLACLSGCRATHKSTLNAFLSGSRKRNPGPQPSARCHSRENEKKDSPRGRCCRCCFCCANKY